MFARTAAPLCVVLLSVVAVAHVRWAPNIGACPALPSHTPANITDMTPGSIKVMALLGDSIGAGFAMDGIEGLVDEFRGKVALIGGDRGEITAANFMAHYSPALQGRSEGKRLGEITSKSYKYHPAVDVLNAAQSGARSDALVREVAYMVTQMQSNARIDFANDYKMVSILIGANDGCSVCHKDGQYNNITQLADTFEVNVPRTLVVLYPMLSNMTNLWRINQASAYCRFVHSSIAKQECGCAFYGGANITDTLYFNAALNAMDDRVTKIVRDWQTSGNNASFAVTMQPFFRYMNFPDGSYLSSLDCFHPSVLANQQIAVSAWNSLFVPLAKKTLTWQPDEQLYCPTANDRIYAN